MSDILTILQSLGVSEKQKNEIRSIKNFLSQNKNLSLEILLGVNSEGNNIKLEDKTSTALRSLTENSTVASEIPNQEDFKKIESLIRKKKVEILGIKGEGKTHILDKLKDAEAEISGLAKVADNAKDSEKKKAAYGEGVAALCHADKELLKIKIKVEKNINSIVKFYQLESPDVICISRYLDLKNCLAQKDSSSYDERLSTCVELLKEKKGKNDFSLIDLKNVKNWLRFKSTLNKKQNNPTTGNDARSPLDESNTNQLVESLKIENEKLKKEIKEIKELKIQTTKPISSSPASTENITKSEYKYGENNSDPLFSDEKIFRNLHTILGSVLEEKDEELQKLRDEVIAISKENKKLSEELKELKQNSVNENLRNNSIKGLAEILKEQRQKLDEKKEETNNLKEELEKSKQNDELQKRKGNLVLEISTLEEKLTKTQEELTSKLSEYDNVSQTLQTEQAKNQTLTKELASKKNIINTLQEKIDKSSSDREKESLDSATIIKDKDKVLDQLKKQLEEEKKKLDTLSKEKSESDKNIITLKNEVENFQTKNNDLKSDLGKKSKELDKLKTESLEIKQQLQNEKNKSGDLQSQIEKATTLKRQQEETLEKEKQKLIKAQKETAELQTEKEQLEQQLVEAKDLQKKDLAFKLSNDKETHEQEKVQLAKKISDLETKIKEKSDELLTLKTSNSESIVALQKKIQEKKSKIEEIQNKNRETVEKLQASINSKETVIEETVKERNKLKEAHDKLQTEHRDMLKDLKNQLAEEKTKALEESNTHQQKITQQEEKYKELSNKLNEETKNLEDLELDLTTQTEALTKLKKEKTEIEEKLKTSQEKENELTDELSKLETTNETLTKKLDTSEVTISNLHKESEETEEKANRLKSALDEQKQKTTEAEDKLSQVNDQLGTNQKIIDKNQEQLEEMNTFKRKSEEEIKQKTQKLIEAQKAITELQTEKEQLEQQAKDLQKTLETSKQSINNLEKEKESSLNDKKVHEQEKRQLENKVSVLEAKIKEKSGELLALEKSNNESIEALDKKIEEKESKIEEIQNKNGKIVEELQASIKSKETSIEEHVKKTNALKTELQHNLEELTKQFSEEKTKALEGSNEAHQLEIIQEKEKYKELSNEIDEKTKKLEEFRDNFKKTTETLMELKKEKTEMENKIKMSQAEEARLKDELSDLKNSNETLTRKLKTNETKISDLQNQSKETEEKANKLKSALSKQQQKTTESEASLNQLEKQLQEVKVEKKQLQQETDTQLKKLLESENMLKKSNNKLQELIDEKDKSKLTTGAIATQTEPLDATSDDKLPSHNSTTIRNNMPPTPSNVPMARAQSAPDLSGNSPEQLHDNATDIPAAEASNITDSSSQSPSKESEDENKKSDQKKLLQNQHKADFNSHQIQVKSEDGISKRGSSMSAEEQLADLNLQENFSDTLAKNLQEYFSEQVAREIDFDHKSIILKSIQDSLETTAKALAEKVNAGEWDDELKQARTELISEDPTISKNYEEAANQLSKKLIGNAINLIKNPIDITSNPEDNHRATFQTSLLKAEKELIKQAKEIEKKVKEVMPLLTRNKDILNEFTKKELEKLAIQAGTEEFGDASLPEELLKSIEDNQKFKEHSLGLVNYLPINKKFRQNVIITNEGFLESAKKLIPEAFQEITYDGKTIAQTAEDIGKTLAKEIQSTIDNSERRTSSSFSISSFNGNEGSHPNSGDSGRGTGSENEDNSLITNDGEHSIPDNNYTAEGLKAALLEFSQNKKGFHKLPMPLKALQYASLLVPEEFSLAIQAVCSISKKDADEFNSLNSFESLRNKLRYKAFKNITKSDGKINEQDIQDIHNLEAKLWLEKKLEKITHRTVDIGLTEIDQSTVTTKIKEKLLLSALNLSAVTLKPSGDLNIEIEKLKKYELKLIAKTYQEYSKIESKLSQYPTLLKESNDNASSADEDHGFEEEGDLQHFTATLNEKLSDNTKITEHQASALIDAISKQINPPCYKWSLVGSTLDSELVNNINDTLKLENEVLNNSANKKKLVLAAINLLREDYQLAATLRAREAWEKNIKQHYALTEGIAYLRRVNVKSRITLLEEMRAKKIAHTTEDKSTLGQPGPVYLPNSCKIIEEDKKLAQQEDLSFTATGETFHRRDALEKNVPVIYEQDLGDKKQLWCVMRTPNDALAYKTKGESKWNLKNVTQKAVAFTQMVDAVQSFKDSRIVSFTFGNCSKATEKKYRIFIHAYNDLGIGPFLSCQENNAIALKTKELEQAKEEIKKQLKLQTQELDENIKKMPDLSINTTPRLRARG